MTPDCDVTCETPGFFSQSLFVCAHSCVRCSRRRFIHPCRWFTVVRGEMCVFSQARVKGKRPWSRNWFIGFSQTHYPRRPSFLAVMSVLRTSFRLWKTYLFDFLSEMEVNLPKCHHFHAVASFSWHSWNLLTHSLAKMWLEFQHQYNSDCHRLTGTCWIVAAEGVNGWRISVFVLFILEWRREPCDIHNRPVEC